MIARRASPDDDEADLFFDQWLMPGSPVLHAVTRWVELRLENVEVRERGRRAGDQAIHTELIGTIVANVARGVLLKGPNARVAIVKSKNKEAGYERSALRQLSRSLGELEDAGLLFHHPARKPGFSGTISPSAEMAQEVIDAKVRFSDLARHPDEEVLELRWSHYERRGGGSPVKEREKLPVRDSSKVRRFRTQVRKLNSYLAGADITIEGGAEAERIDNHDRRLRRHFTILKRDDLPEWNLNGRLFGGFWQTLPKTRRHLIRIDGRTLADLDYKNLFLRLAYCSLGVEPPKGDLYAKLGFPSRYRPGIKALVSAFLFARRRRWDCPSSGFLGQRAASFKGGSGSSVC